MKVFALGLAAIFVASSCAKVGAQTGNLESVKSSAKTAPLTMLQLDPQLGITHNYGGSVTIDEAKKTVQVSIKTCPPGAKCIVGDRVFVAKIISSYTDECGAIVTEAKTDNRPVDGALTEMTVVDNSNPNGKCLGKKAVMAVELRTSIRSSSTTSTLIGQVPLK